MAHLLLLLMMLAGHIEPGRSPCHCCKRNALFITFVMLCVPCDLRVLIEDILLMLLLPLFCRLWVNRHLHEHVNCVCIPVSISFCLTASSSSGIALNIPLAQHSLLILTIVHLSGIVLPDEHSACYSAARQRWCKLSA